MFKQYQFRNYRFKLVFLVYLLTTIGILVIGSAEESYQSQQILGLVLGSVAMLVCSLIDYNILMQFHWLVYVFIIILLVVVLTPLGKVVNGAQRWIDLKFMTLQPSELAKVMLSLFFAKFFSDRYDRINEPFTIASSIVLFGIPAFLILKEPDLSTTITIALVFCGMIFIAGFSYRFIGSMLAVIAPVALVFLGYVMREDQKLLEEYQRNRIMAWLNPSEHADLAYQQQNSIMAIGSGQLTGKGLNNDAVASVKNADYIAEPQTDFIFAVAGEELGFIGTAAIIILLLLIVIEIIAIGRNAKDMAGNLLCCGIAAWIGFQSFINICVATGLMPNTGVPLPFVSYGLTSLVSLYIAIGFVLNVGLQPRKY